MIDEARRQSMVRGEKMNDWSTVENESSTHNPAQQEVELAQQEENNSVDRSDGLPVTTNQG